MLRYEARLLPEFDAEELDYCTQALTLGPSGLMQAHAMGAAKRGLPWPAVLAFTEHLPCPVGWAIFNAEHHVEMFVDRNWRKQGVATGLWRCMARIVGVEPRELRGYPPADHKVRSRASGTSFLEFPSLECSEGLLAEFPCAVLVHNVTSR